MKKLLSATLALAIGASCIGTLAACKSDNSDNDAELAKKAIATVRTLYADKSEITDVDYDLNATVVVDQVTYNVDWTVIPDAALTIDIKDYVSVGEPSGSKVHVSITKADEEIKYTLKASVTVGSATESAEFNRKVTAKATAHTGTLEDPYTPANVKEIASTMTPKTKLEESDDPQPVHVKGYIVDKGSDQKDNNRVGYVYIAEEYEVGKDKNAEDAVMILSINYGDKLTSYADVELGAEIIVKGYIMNYKKNDSSPEQYEVTYYGSNGVTCEYYKKIELTDAQKVEAAKLALTITTSYTEGTYNLPATQGDATLTWSVKSGSNVKVENNVLTVTNPEAETPAKLTVTIQVNDAEDTKDFDITIQTNTTPGTVGNPYTVAQAQEKLNGLDSGKTYQEVEGVDKEVHVTGYVTDAGTVGNYGYNKVKIADTKGDTANSVLIWSINWGEALPTGTELEVGDEITVRGYLLNHSTGGKEIGQSGSGSSAIYPKIVVLNKVVLTDLEKAQKELDKVKTTLTTITAVPESKTVDLPTSEVDGVTLNWSSSHATYTVTNNKLNVAARPTDEDAVVTLSVTATCGDDTTAAKTVMITIKKETGGNEDTVTSAAFDFKDVANAQGAQETSNLLTLLKKAGGELDASGNETEVKTLLTSVDTATNIYAGDGSSGGCIKFGASGKTGALQLTFEKNVTKITINCTGWDGQPLNSKTADKISVKDAKEGAITLNGKGGTHNECAFTFETASNSITINSTNRVIIFSIVVEFE